MGAKILDIPAFCRYLNVNGLKSSDLHIVDFQSKEDIRLQSAPVIIDFYFLAIKPPMDNRLKPYELLEDQADSSYMYVDCPRTF